MYPVSVSFFYLSSRRKENLKYKYVHLYAIKMYVNNNGNNSSVYVRRKFTLNALPRDVVYCDCISLEDLRSVLVFFAFPRLGLTMSLKRPGITRLLAAGEVLILRWRAIDDHRTIKAKRMINAQFRRLCRRDNLIAPHCCEFPIDFTYPSTARESRLYRGSAGVTFYLK